MAGVTKNGQNKKPLLEMSLSAYPNYNEGLYINGAVRKKSSPILYRLISINFPKTSYFALGLIVKAIMDQYLQN